MDTSSTDTMTAAASAYFLRQLASYGVSSEQFARAAPRSQADPSRLVLAWTPAQSDIAPLRVERNHLAVFVLNELELGPGQVLQLQGPSQERTAMLIRTLRMAADARLEIAMPSELLVNQLLADEGARFVLAGPSGENGLNGVAGSAGPNGGPGQPGGAGGFGGSANPGLQGCDSGSARICIAQLNGHVVFEVAAGAGGNGGDGGRGGNGGMGWVDPARRAMTMGGTGGAGGAGAPGGSGGNGGRMQVFIASLGPRASFSTVTTAAAGGAGGAGGGPGMSGMGHPDGAMGIPGPAGNRGGTGNPGWVEVLLV